jgi:hypothetical protein
VSHTGDRASESGGVVALAVAGLLFVATLTFGAVLLPDHVDVYFAPADRPDVSYELWQYLTLVAIGVVVLAMASAALASAALSLVSAFREGSLGRSDVAAWVGAWTFVWFSAGVWLAIWLGNENPETRSWYELLLGLTGVAGVALIVLWRAELIRWRRG